MKDTFFTLLALSIPLVIFAGILYMFGQGLYTVARDWHERRQMDRLRRETQILRQQKRAAEQEVERSESGKDASVEAAPDLSGVEEPIDKRPEERTVPSDPTRQFSAEAPDPNVLPES